MFGFWSHARPAHFPAHFPLRAGRFWCIFQSVTTSEATRLLEQFRNGKITLEKALHAFQAPPVDDLGFAQVDHHRALRKGFPEVIYGAGKTAEQIATIAAHLFTREKRFLITRISPEKAKVVKRPFYQPKYK